MPFYISLFKSYFSLLPYAAAMWPTRANLANPGTSKIKATVTPTEGTPIEFPEGTVFEKFIISDGNLYLVEPDGSIIAIIGGALNPPTILIGSPDGQHIELPSQLIAASIGSGGGHVS